MESVMLENVWTKAGNLEKQKAMELHISFTRMGEFLSFVLTVIIAGADLMDSGWWNWSATGKEPVA